MPFTDPPKPLDKNARIALAIVGGVVVLGGIWLAAASHTPVAPPPSDAERAATEAKQAAASQAAASEAEAKSKAAVLNPLKLAVARQDNAVMAARKYSGRSFRVLGRIKTIEERNITVWTGSDTQSFDCAVTSAMIPTLHTRDWVIIYGALTFSSTSSPATLSKCEVLWTGDKHPLTDAELENDQDR